jgi:hypothetical protein
MNPVEDREMDRFWVFLEAVAGFLDNSQSVEALKRDLLQMPQSEREKMKDYLRLVFEKIEPLATDGESTHGLSETH